MHNQKMWTAHGDWHEWKEQTIDIFFIKYMIEQ